MNVHKNAKAYRGAIAHLLDTPATAGLEAFVHFEDGVLVVEDGHIAGFDDANKILTRLDPGIPVQEFRQALIVPGFVDTHIHYPQLDIIASHGYQLLDWLNTYTFPQEEKFSDPVYAAEVADIFITELLRNGTTSALVYGTVHAISVNAVMEAALAHNMRVTAGKVLMDRNVPEAVRDTAESGYLDSRKLIRKWHGKGRLGYAVTPRFAAACSPEQLEAASRLLQEFPDVLMQTHISETRSEIEWVRQLFPDSRNYVDVYDQHGLVTDRSIFAHGVHLCDREIKRLALSNSALAFCPTSNLFLGSGLFDLETIEGHAIKVGLGTDVGGGDSFSILKTLNEAYKVCQLRGQTLLPTQGLYLATLGGARALNLDHQIGNFEIGKEADFVVLDKRATPIMARRISRAKNIADVLFAFFVLGDDRAVQHTFIAGECRYTRPGPV